MTNVDQEVLAIESAATDSSETQAFKFWEIVRRRKWRIALGVVVGLAAAIGFHQLTGPWYESTAQLLVIKKKPPQVLELGPAGHILEAQDYLPTHLVVITSHPIVRPAVDKYRLQDLDSFQQQSLLGGIINSVSRLIFPAQPAKGSPEEAATKAISDSLVVSSASPKFGEPPSREVFYLSFRGKVSEDCRTILNAVAASYQDFWRNLYRNMNADALTVVQLQKEMLEIELKDRTEKHQKFANGILVQWRGRDANATTIPQEVMFELEKQKKDFLTRRDEIEVTLTAIQSAQEKGQHSYAYMLSVLSLSGGLPNRDSLAPSLPNGPGMSNSAGPRISPEEVLLKLLQLRETELSLASGPNSRELQSVRAQISSLKSMLTPSSATGDKVPGQDDWERGFVTMRINALEQELTYTKGLVAKLDPLIKSKQKDAAAALRQLMSEEADLKDIEGTRSLLEAANKRLLELKTVQDYGGYDIRVIASPEAGKWYLKKYLLVLALALFTGLLGGVGWAYWAEVTDKRFRTSEEIGQRLGLPVLGHIPVLPEGARALHQVQPKQTAMDPVLCAHYRSSSPGAEAYRIVRTALYFSKHTQGHHIIQITSPESGAGKTTLAANLAVSIAQSGKRTLLIDADFRRPRLHTIYGMPNQVGFTTLLAGQAELPQAIQESGVLGLSILTSGPIPPNPSELLSSPRLKELFDCLRQQYDFVLVDTPPLLAVTDPCVVASRVDGVVLTIGNSKNSRPCARRARAILDTIGAKVLGVVVNGVRRRHAAGNYVY